MTGLLVSLLILVSYFEMPVIMCVLFIILTQFLVIYGLYFNRTKYDDERKNYQPDETGFNHPQNFITESKYVFITAVFTAWITPCTVWTNNFTHKSYFLIISSLTTTVAHMLCLSCAYNYTTLHLIPLTNLMQIQILYSEMENPKDFFDQVVVPLGFILIIISFTASVFLHYLGNYYTMFQWSRIILCGRPIVTASLLQDLIRNSPEKISPVISYVLKNNRNILSYMDNTHGDTLMNTAAMANSFKLLKVMIKHGANCFTKNEGDKNILDLLESKMKESHDKEEKENCLDILNVLKTKDVKDYLLRSSSNKTSLNKR